MLTSNSFKLTREKTITFLQKLEEYDEEAISVFIPAGISVLEAENTLGSIEVSQISQDVIKSVGNSLTGSIVFWGNTQRYVISPPFPIKEKYITNSYDVEPLLSILTRDYTIGIILIRLGSYSIGICQGETLIEHFTGTGLVHGRHRQGGSSSARFQRRRQDQTQHFVERACEHIRQKFAPHAKNFNYLVYGGSRTAILQLRKQCQFLEQFDDRLLPPMLEIPDPHFNILEKAVMDVWSCKVTEWAGS